MHKNAIKSQFSLVVRKILIYLNHTYVIQKSLFAPNLIANLKRAEPQPLFSHFTTLCLPE